MTPSRHQRFEMCRLRVSSSILEAMRCMDDSGTEVVLAVDEHVRFVGTLTDGDMRRALLAGNPLDAEIRDFVHRDFTAVSPAVGRSEVLDLMRARLIRAVPVLDAAGALVGLHLLHEILGGVERPNCAVIMAGGEGRRLRPLTEDVPKPMIRVAGRPILERLVLHLVGFGIRRIFLSVNYLGHLIEEHFGDGSRLGCRIEYLREDRPLGTAGSLALIPEVLHDPLLVLNGDLVTQADIAGLLEAHGAAARLTIGVRRYFHTVPFGCVELQGARVVRIDEKPRIERLISAGIYCVEPSVIAAIPAGQPYPMTALIEHLLASGQQVGVFEIQDDWIDVGQRDELVRAQGREP